MLPTSLKFSLQLPILSLISLFNKLFFDQSDSDGEKGGKVQWCAKIFNSIFRLNINYKPAQLLTILLWFCKNFQKRHLMLSERWRMYIRCLCQCISKKILLLSRLYSLKKMTFTILVSLAEPMRVNLRSTYSSMSSIAISYIFNFFHFDQ